MSFDVWCESAGNTIVLMYKVVASNYTPETWTRKPSMIFYCTIAFLELSSFTWDLRPSPCLLFQMLISVLKKGREVIPGAMANRKCESVLSAKQHLWIQRQCWWAWNVNISSFSTSAAWLPSTSNMFVFASDTRPLHQFALGWLNHWTCCPQIGYCIS